MIYQVHRPSKLNCLNGPICCSDWHRTASITQRAPGQAIEGGDFSRHLVEQPFNAHKPVLTGDTEDQFVQELPFWPGVAWWLNSFQEFLDAAFGIGESAALLGMRAAGQQIMRQLCCL